MRKSLGACLLAGITLAAVSLARSGQDDKADGDKGPRKVVINARPSAKLAKELHALVLAGGELLGRTPAGGAVVQLPASADSANLKKMAANPGVVSVDDKVPAEVQPVQRLIVMYTANNPLTAEELKKKGFQVVEHNETGGFFVVAPAAKKGAGGIQASSVMALQADDSVRFVEPVYRYSIPPRNKRKGPAKGQDKAPAKKSTKGTAKADQAKHEKIPNDGHFNDLWGMRHCRAPGAWSKVMSSPVIVALIDTGVDYNHPDLKENMWKNPGEVAGDGKDNDGNGIVDDVFGANFFGPKDDGDPKDIDSHGTHCAGTVGAKGNNADGVAGVCWDVKIMALRFMGPDEEGEITGPTQDAVEAIDYAVKHGAKVISASWGGGGNSRALSEAIKRAEDKGVLFVAAAGNGHWLTALSLDNDAEPHYPSSYEHANIISVLAVNSDDTLGEFLNRNQSFSNYGNKSVDLGAPGGRNLDLGLYVLSSVPGNQYEDYPGTSMATPHVAGAVALVWGHPSHQSATWQQVRDLLLSNARPVAGLKGKCVTGGTLDLSFLGQ